MGGISGISQMVGLFMSLTGMASGMVSQGTMIHNQLSPPQQQAQAAAQCQPPTVPMIEIKADGTRQLVCVQQQMVQP